MDRLKLTALPFDRFQRLQRVAEMLRAIQGRVSLKQANIVADIGGRDGQLVDFLDTEHTLLVADRHLIAARPACLYIKADGNHLPLADDSIWFSVSLDTLEHIGEPRRLAFIQEFYRVTSQVGVLTFPQAAALNDRLEELLFQLSKHVQGFEDLFLKEHRQRGLPDFASLLPKCPGKWEFFGAHNSFLWFLMMVIKRLFSSYGHDVFFDDLSRELDVVYNHYLSGFDNAPPHYRTFAVLYKSAAPQGIFSDIFSSTAVNKPFDKQHFAQFVSAFAMTAVKSEAKHISRMAKLMHRYESHFGDFNRMIREKDHVIGNLIEDTKRLNQIIADFNDVNNSRFARIKGIVLENQSLSAKISELEQMLKNREKRLQRYEFFLRPLRWIYKKFKKTKQ